MKILTLRRTEKLSIVTLATNYQKLSLVASFYIFYHLCSGSDEILKNKNQCKIFNLVIVTSSKLYFHSLLESFKGTSNKHREPNFCHKFHLFKCLEMHELNIDQCGIDYPTLMLVSQFFELAITV